MEENNKIIPIQQNTLIPRVTNSLRITNKLLSGLNEQLIPYRKGNKWGFCTPDKRIVIDCIYENAFPFINGLAKVELGEDWYCIDEKNNLKGNTNSPFVDVFNGEFSEGLQVDFKNNKLGFINSNSEVVIAHKYEDDGFFSFFKKFSEGLCDVSLDGKGGYIDTFGKEVIPFILSSTNAFSQGLAAVSIESKFGFIDINGNFVIPLIYDSAHNFIDGLASVKKDSKWGFIDKDGSIIIPIIYDEAFYFKEGLANVKKDNKWGFIDKEGNIIIPIVYDIAFFFSEGLASVKIDSKWGFIDKVGKIKIPFIYSSAIGGFENNLFKVKIEDKEKGYIDKQGTQFWED